jgi:hypothetical protein
MLPEQKSRAIQRGGIVADRGLQATAQPKMKGSVNASGTVHLRQKSKYH